MSGRARVILEYRRIEPPAGRFVFSSEVVVGALLFLWIAVHLLLLSLVR